MLENVLQEKKIVDFGKCAKCKTRNATKEDQMCDNCRFLNTIENILKNRKE